MYKKFFEKKFFPEITKRYKEKYDESFPSTGTWLLSTSSVISLAVLYCLSPPLWAEC